MKIHLLKKLRKKEQFLLSQKNSGIRIFMTLILCFGSILCGYAQTTKKITGKVSDEMNDAVIGASITIGKGSPIGTTTNVSGEFSLEVPASTTQLFIACIGYEPQTVNIQNKTTVNVVMIESLQQLDEVVVVGYGTQKKATLTGSVAAVNNEQIMITKSGNVQNMLTGKLPGLRVIQKTSEPGQFTNQFDIRGLGNPLLVVDGVPRGDMPRMDPNDIESVSILKDASAAIYGMRAANGVMLITTKKGEKGKAQIEYTGYYGIQTPAEILQPLNSWDRAILYNETTMRNTSTPTKEYSPEYFEKLKRGELPSTDWYGAIIRDQAPQQQHNVSISGGTDKSDYYVNFGYNEQESFFKTNSANYNRYNLRTNLNAQITKDLKAGIRLNMMTDETDRQNMSSWEVFKMLWRSRPTDPLYANNTSPYFYHPDVEFNPLASIYPDVSGYVSDKKNIFQSNMQLDYTVPFIKGLTATAMFSYDKTYNDNTNYKKEYAEYRYNSATESYETTLRNSKTNLNRLYSTSYSTMWNARLNYTNTFSQAHNVSALLLYEESYNQGYDFSAFRYFDIPIPYLFAGNTENQLATGSGLSENASRAFAGRFNYDFKGKYIAELSFRYDGCSKFPKGAQWGFFPSLLLAYRISEESFIKDNVPFLNNLKLRGTLGKVGDETASQFQFVEGYDYPQNYHNKQNIPRGYVFGNTFVNALGFRNAPNLNLTWYTADILNIGVDADLWNGLFGFSVDLFERNRSGLLDYPSVVIPGTFGSGISQTNLNSDRVKGFEVELRHHNRVGDFDYNISAFVQMTRRMWTKLLQTNRSNSYDYWLNNTIGRYNDIWFGKGSAGTYGSYNDIANSIYATGGTLPGDPIYEDWNGDGVIDDNDKHPIATTVSGDMNAKGLPGTNLNDARNYPLMNFGTTIGGQWKWVDLSILFQGAAMSYVGYGEQLLNPLAWDGNALERLYDRWHPVDPDKDPYDPTNSWVSGHYPYGKTRAEETSKFNIQNGAYVRLKSAEIGFTVPKNYLFEKTGIKYLRLFVNAYNLLTITGVDGLDPEKPAENYGYLYPLNRTFNFGGTIKF